MSEKENSVPSNKEKTEEVPAQNEIKINEIDIKEQKAEENN